MDLLKLGTTLSHTYRIERVRLQMRDMVLYEGTDTSDRRVCIKVFRRDPEDPELSARFERELRAPDVIDVGTANGMRFVVVDLRQHAPKTPSQRPPPPPPRTKSTPPPLPPRASKSTPPLPSASKSTPPPLPPRTKSTPPPLPPRATKSTPPPLPVEVPIVVDEPLFEGPPPLAPLPVAAPPPPISQTETGFERPASSYLPRRSPVWSVVAFLVIAAMTGAGGWLLGHQTSRPAPAANAPILPQSEATEIAAPPAPPSTSADPTPAQTDTDN
ncbi:MAG TPA: hypothetical protein VLM85_25380 [Polyangiaceae bacterium]|nr:hypothetical protein [Polyangiaceae bacterium]